METEKLNQLLAQKDYSPEPVSAFMSTQSPLATPPTRIREFAESVSPSYNIERRMAAAHAIEKDDSVERGEQVVIHLATDDIPCNRSTTYALDEPW